MTDNLLGDIVSSMIPMADIIVKRFRASGLSINALAREAGVNYAALYRFLHGQGDPQLTTVTKLCGVLGLALTPVDVPKAAKSPARVRARGTAAAKRGKGGR